MVKMALPDFLDDESEWQNTPGSTWIRFVEPEDRLKSSNVAEPKDDDGVSLSFELPSLEGRSHAIPSSPESSKESPELDRIKIVDAYLTESTGHGSMIRLLTQDGPRNGASYNPRINWEYV
jgi:hypothetical protein